MVMAFTVQHQPRLASLENIPNEVLHEILSYLPTLTESYILFTYFQSILPSTSFVRTSVLRALSKTSRLLRFRCLPMAWCRLELCTVPINNRSDCLLCGPVCSQKWVHRGHRASRAISEATEAAISVLNACPHLHPFIQTVAVILMGYRFDEVVPAFAACLTKMPNLTSIQVIYVDSPHVPTNVEKGFQGQQFPSVRKVSLPFTAHPILRSLPNVEEVVCTEGGELPGDKIVDSLVKGDCRRIRMLKGVSAPFAPLVPVLPDLRYIGVPQGEKDLKSLADFPFLDTIEIMGRYPPLPKSQIEEASDILKANASHANNKAVILTHRIWFRGDPKNVICLIVKV